MSGVNVHVYPSPMTNESRILRLASVAQQSRAFECTALVGTSAPDQADYEHIGEHLVIKRLGTPSPSRGTRMLNRLLWEPRVFFHSLRLNIRVLQVHSVWGLPTGWAVSAAKRCALVYNAHELETRTPTMRGLKGLIARLIERHFIRKCSLVSVVNDPIREWYESRYIGVQPITVRNIPLVANSDTAASEPSVREVLGLHEGAFLYIHTGRLTEGRNIAQAIEAFQRGELQGRHLLFLGAGPLESSVRDAAARWPNIHWLPPVGHDRVTAIVAQADVALCLIDPISESYRLSSPNKFFEAVAARTPVVCTDLPAVQAVLGDRASTWTIYDCAPTTLAMRLARIGPDDVRLFRDDPPALPSWSEEADVYLRELTNVISEGRRC